MLPIIQYAAAVKKNNKKKTPIFYSTVPFYDQKKFTIRNKVTILIRHFDFNSSSRTVSKVNKNN